MYAIRSYYVFVKALHNAFRRRGVERQAVAVVTQTVVDRNDPAFAQPTKPIGSHMEQARAQALADKYHWTVREDAGRGWRRRITSYNVCYTKLLRLHRLHLAHVDARATG